MLAMIYRMAASTGMLSGDSEKKPAAKTSPVKQSKRKTNATKVPKQQVTDSPRRAASRRSKIQAQSNLDKLQMNPEIPFDQRLPGGDVKQLFNTDLEDVEPKQKKSRISDVEIAKPYTAVKSEKRLKKKISESKQEQKEDDPEDSSSDDEEEDPPQGDN